MTTNLYKKLILEAFLKKAEFDKLAHLQDTFLKTLQSKCVSYVKVEDTFNNKIEKSSWIRQYTFDCSETDTVQITVTNSKTQSADISIWDVSCYCDYKLGTVYLTNATSSILLSLLDRYYQDATIDIVSEIKNLIDDGSSLSVDDDQSRAYLIEVLKQRFNATVLKNLIKVQVNDCVLTLTNTGNGWDLDCELIDVNCGKFKLTDKSIDVFVQKVMHLAYKHPKLIFNK